MALGDSVLSAERGGLMNRREFLKRAGVLYTAAVLALYASPSDAADPAPVIVLVTYHSATGNTETMAQGMGEGAKAVSGTSVVLKRVGEVTGDDLVSADAVIVGSPVYVGDMSGQVKTFFDLGRSQKTECSPAACSSLILIP
jgi:NAD(P)H dehydrogenase (quinone)